MHHVRIHFVFLLLVVGLSNYSVAQNVVFVSGVSGTDINTCGGVGAPCQTIQYAVDTIALDGDTIQIDTGVYALPSTVGVDTPVVKIPEGKSLAFLGTSSGLGTRIDGGGVRRGFLYYYAGGSCTSASPNDGISDSLTFYFDGLIIQNGHIAEMCGTTSYAYGGGMRLDCDSVSTMHVTITNCVFIDNRAYDYPGTFAGGRSASGGAIFIFGRRLATASPALYSEAHISNCEFTGNYADQNYNGGHGGAVFLRDLDTSSVTNSSFCDNYVYSTSADNGDLQHDRNAGGAICVYDLWSSTPGHNYSIDECSFINNSATTNNGLNFSFQSEGGAIFLTKGDVLNALTSASVKISNSRFYANTIEPGIEHIDKNGGNIDTSSVGLNAYYNQFQVDLGNDTSICAGDSIELDAWIPGGTYHWQDGSTGSSYVVHDSGQYEVTVTVGNCETYDTILINVQAYPVLNLGGDTTLCPYDTLLLNAFVQNAQYVWSTGSTDSAIYVGDAGMVWVSVTLNGCTSQDSILIDTVDISDVVLGPDTTVCPNAQFNLNAYTNGANYHWQNGSSNSTFTVTSGGTYMVTVNKASCTVVDSIEVIYVEELLDVIGADTIACETDTVYKVVTPFGLDQILWSDGSTDSIKAITQPGTYSVTVNDRGCLFSDEVDISFKPLPAVDLGNDTGECSGVFIVLDAYLSDATFQWSNGSSSPYVAVGASGVYSVTVTKNGCSATDEIEVQFDQTPIVELPEILHLCEGQTYQLRPPKAIGDFEWSTSSNTASIQVTEPGTYAVTVSMNGCVGSDSTLVKFAPYPVVNLGRDSFICEESSIRLKAKTDSAEYLWQDSSSLQYFSVDSGGSYWLQVTKNGCVSSDTIRFKQRYLPKVNLGNDTILCLGESFTLNQTDEHTIYLWNSVNHANSHAVKDSGLVTVEGENFCGSVYDSIFVSMVQCDCSFYVPNAFTTYLDDVNDVFQVSYDCDITKFQITIYDRWGKDLFSSEDPDFKWDGNFEGRPLPVGAYAYVIEYQAIVDMNPNPIKHKEQGVVSILR